MKTVTPFILVAALVGLAAIGCEDNRTAGTRVDRTGTSYNEGRGALQSPQAAASPSPTVTPGTGTHAVP